MRQVKGRGARLNAAEKSRPSRQRPGLRRLALLLVDVINPCDFPEADDSCEPPSRRRSNRRLTAPAGAKEGVPVVYANDNFGRWRSDLRRSSSAAWSRACKGRPLARAAAAARGGLLRPQAEALGVLLYYAGRRCSATSGASAWCSADSRRTSACCSPPTTPTCATASSSFRTTACASNEAADNAFALTQMAKVLKADVRASTELDLERMRGPRRRRRLQK